MALALLLILVATTVAVVAMLLVRKFLAPKGSYLHDMEPADGIFGAAGAGLAVLLAFVIFTVFESYQSARTGTGTEAVATQQLYATAGFFDPPGSNRLKGEVICYARSVIHDEWPDMAHGTESKRVQYWVDALDTTMQQQPVVGNKGGATLEHWFDTSQDRQEGRRTRLAEARPFVPPFVWIVLIAMVLVVVAFQCLFADPGATAFGQSLAMASMAGTLVAALTLIWVLDRPFNDRGAQIQPIRMEAALAVMTHQGTGQVPLPCDEVGAPR